MKWILVFILSISLISCSGLRKDLVKLSQSDLKNAEASRVISKNLLSTWPINSGFIRGGLGDRLNQMPGEFIKAMEELDKLSMKTEWSDFELGYSLGLRVRLLGEIITNTLKTYAPEVLKYLPLVF